MSVDPKYIKNLQGKDHVLYPGLLDLAHKKGLVSMETEIIAVPSSENNQTAIVYAKAKFGRGEEERVFTGIGDASPVSVNRAMANCIVRMAETRAKARALRDALNIGEAAFEELGGEDTETEPTAPQRPSNGYQITVDRPADTATTSKDIFVKKAHEMGFIGSSAGAVVGLMRAMLNSKNAADEEGNYRECLLIDNETWADVIREVNALIEARRAQAGKEAIAK